MEENNEMDLGKDTFLVRWPNWLRWLLFLPASVLVPAVFLLIYSIFNGWFLDLGPNAFYFNLMRGIAYGAGCVYIGAMVAPKKQKTVAMFLLIIIAMISGVATF